VRLQHDPGGDPVRGYHHSAPVASAASSITAMLDPTPLLLAPDDTTLRQTVMAIGGFDRARQAILDRAVRIQPFGSLEDYRALIAVFDRVKQLARHC
jgi:hypothetical protein